MKTHYLETSADVSPCRAYRYRLSRRLSEGDRTILFVALNPSTADAELDDPTIRRCVRFARKWGYDRLLMGNLCAYRSTDPRALQRVGDPVGPSNQEALQRMVREAKVVVAAWGREDRLTEDARRIADGFGPCRTLAALAATRTARQSIRCMCARTRG